MSERRIPAKEQVVREMFRGREMYGQYASTHEAVAVIREEYLEFEREVFHGTPEAAVKEAVQLAATAMRFVMEFGNGERAATR